MVDGGWGFEPTIPGAAAALLGVLVGFPALRVRGLYLALVTLGLAVLVPGSPPHVKGAGGVALLRPDRSSSPPAWGSSRTTSGSTSSAS